MRRISEEAKGILNCYDLKDKHSVIHKLEKDKRFVNDPAMNILIEEILGYLKNCNIIEYRELCKSVMIDLNDMEAAI